MSPRGSRVRRLGLFGGTFDPPHLGHLVLAERARDRLDLGRVLFMPTGVPPHKRRRTLTAATDRVEMVRRATRGNPAFRVSTLETRRRGASYTVETLRALASAHRGTRLYLLVGEDSLEEFSTWHEPEAILSLATLVVAPRPRSRGAAIAATRASASRDLALTSPSSTSPRARSGSARTGGSIRYLGAGRGAALHRAAPALSGSAMTTGRGNSGRSWLSRQFDLRGTGEVGLPLAYNRACYALRREGAGPRAA